MDPKSIIPHRPPFLFLDEVTSIEPGKEANGYCKLTVDEWFFEGHFPNRPTLPGVLMVEALAQLGACAVLLDGRFAGKLPLFGGIDRARFRRQVLPQDQLDLEITMTRLGSKGGTGSGRASVNGQLAAEVDILFVVVSM
ncbi:MAG: 3-hydroxyacyl-ACP dehydratase FabZ [Acidimicrobiales bacterium]|nr:3-hydroxyacyl-ACP dehydratase FabZ [Acidimicrobiales bacterium]